ncbi:MAG: class I SAM-dependent methyltransferase [Chloroflexi bacterium]|nr:class I SAM-dependent methyltransferase [Chloroflexota bacterium]
MEIVEAYYDANTQHEWERLGQRHRTEYAVTMLAFGDYLPRAPATVLDIGGGPGRYAIALAQQGYAVTLLDLSRNNLDFARAKAQEVGVELAACVHGSAVDLSAFPSEYFDVVLLMGPLYHLLAEQARHTALREAGRVLKLGGVIGATFITRYAPVRDSAKREPAWIVEHAEEMQRILETGVLEHSWGGFTDAYFTHPTEVRPLFEAFGFEPLDLIAAEGVVAWIEEGLNMASAAVWDAWVRLNYRLGKDPSVHGAAAHLLYIGRKGQAES